MKSPHLAPITAQTIYILDPFDHTFRLSSNPFFFPKTPLAPHLTHRLEISVVYRCIGINIFVSFDISHNAGKNSPFNNRSLGPEYFISVPSVYQPPLQAFIYTSLRGLASSLVQSPKLFQTKFQLKKGALITPHIRSGPSPYNFNGRRCYNKQLTFKCRQLCNNSFSRPRHGVNQTDGILKSSFPVGQKTSTPLTKPNAPCLNSILPLHDQQEHSSMSEIPVGSFLLRWNSAPPPWTK